MNYLSGDSEQTAMHYMYEAAKMANMALCLRAKCGTVIEKNGIVIGKGYNAPPLDDVRNQTCSNEYTAKGKPNYDRTCCVHAEWRAILDALRTHSTEIVGSTLYFTRVDAEGNIVKSGEPFCTACSKLALDTGIAEFMLWQDAGIACYRTDEYNRVSYLYEHKT